MSTKTKTVGYGKPRMRIKYVTSAPAAQLVEDVHTLSIVLPLLDGLDYDSLTVIDNVEDRRFAEDMHMAVTGLVRSWQRIAQLKLQREMAQ